MKQRGQSLLEGLIASVVLVIGITGVLQAVLVSSAQNAGAGRITEAAAISQQLVNGIQRHDIRQLKASGLLDGSRCTSNSTLVGYVGKIDTLTNIAAGNTLCAKGNCVTSAIVTTTPCVVDLDAYELDGSVPASRKLVSGYDFATRYVSGKPEGYKRMAVIFNNETSARTVNVTVVTSFLDGGVRRYMQRSVTMYTPIGSGAL
jgi:Tfp pilus assembly protein PilV